MKFHLHCCAIISHMQRRTYSQSYILFTHLEELYGGKLFLVTTLRCSSYSLWCLKHFIFMIFFPSVVLCTQLVQCHFDSLSNCLLRAWYLIMVLLRGYDDDKTWEKKMTQKLNDPAFLSSIPFQFFLCYGSKSLIYCEIKTIIASHISNTWSLKAKFEQN